MLMTVESDPTPDDVCSVPRQGIILSSAEMGEGDPRQEVEVEFRGQTSRRRPH